MKDWGAQRVADAAGARLLGRGSAACGPERATIDSRDAGPGALFVGLPGASGHGGRFAQAAIDAGAWGVLSAPDYVEGLSDGVRLAADDPLAALQRLATAWRRELGAKVIGITGSTGKTSTKDLLRAVLEPHCRVVASRANFNTEIGLPLELLAAPARTEVVVLEMGMRGSGQIAELAAIAEPDVGAIVSIGPVHLELLGSVEAIAAAKAELIAGLAPGGTAVLPAGERLLERHLRDDVHVVWFGDGGDVRLASSMPGRVGIVLSGEPHKIELEVSFTQAHLRRNLLAAVAAALAVGVEPSGRVELLLSPGRGERKELPGGLTLIDDCYNANPVSMRAALEDLVSAPSGGRRIAVLGDMLELGPGEREYHVEIGRFAAQGGVDLLVTVGPLAAAMAAAFAGESRSLDDAAQAADAVKALVGPGDAVLVKGSRAVGLELVCRALSEGVAA